MTTDAKWYMSECNVPHTLFKTGYSRKQAFIKDEFVSVIILDA